MRVVDEAREIGRVDSRLAKRRADSLPFLVFRHVRENRNVPRLPRKNDLASIAARREALGLDGEVDLSAYERAAESVTGVAEIPVSVAQLRISLGEYELSGEGDVVERGRAEEDVVVPLAHTEGSLTASMQRGARAVEESGGFRTHVIADRITRASCFVCRDAGDALALARWIEERVPEARDWLRAADMKELSRYAVLREVKTHVVGPMCHVLWRFTTGDAVGANMMTRNAYALNMAFVQPNAPVPIERVMLEANMGGDKKPSFEFFQSGHGKTVIAEATLTDEAIRRVLRTTAEDLDDLAWVGSNGAIASGMQSVAFTPASAIAAVFAATGQDLGMVGTSSMAHGTGRRVDGGLHVSIRFPGLEVGTIGGGTTLPTAREWLALMGCDGAGKVYRLAQITAAAALALEISASSAMATAGSENFFRAHFERGGLR
jgi:hydroxymethylglutaryl-CoA reductase (NADPH)